MTPIKDTDDMTQSSTSIKSKHTYKSNVVSSYDDLMTYKQNIQIEYKKRRNQMKHLTPKKKKRK